MKILKQRWFIIVMLICYVVSIIKGQISPSEGFIISLLFIIVEKVTRSDDE